jgi:hypothetical protein
MILPAETDAATVAAMTDRPAPVMAGAVRLPVGHARDRADDPPCLATGARLRHYDEYVT